MNKQQILRQDGRVHLTPTRKRKAQVSQQEGCDSNGEESESCLARREEAHRVLKKLKRLTEATDRDSAVRLVDSKNRILEFAGLAFCYSADVFAKMLSMPNAGMKLKDAMTYMQKDDLREHFGNSKSNTYKIDHFRGYLLRSSDRRAAIKYMKRVSAVMRPGNSLQLAYLGTGFCNKATVVAALCNIYGIAVNVPAYVSDSLHERVISFKVSGKWSLIGTLIQFHVGRSSLQKSTSHVGRPSLQKSTSHVGRSSLQKSTSHVGRPSLQKSTQKKPSIADSTVLNQQVDKKSVVFEDKLETEHPTERKKSVPTTHALDNPVKDKSNLEKAVKASPTVQQSRDTTAVKHAFRISPPSAFITEPERHKEDQQWKHRSKTIMQALPFNSFNDDMKFPRLSLPIQIMRWCQEAPLEDTLLKMLENLTVLKELEEKEARKQALDRKIHLLKTEIALYQMIGKFPKHHRDGLMANRIRVAAGLLQQKRKKWQF